MAVTMVDDLVPDSKKEHGAEEAGTVSPPANEEELQHGLSDVKYFILITGFFSLWAATTAISMQTSIMLPVLAKELKVSASQVQWVSATNMMTWGCCQIIAGRCCDVYGRKRGLYCGMLVWVLSNVASTFMPNLAGLNVCRGLAGIGVAIMLPATIGMIGVMLPAGKKRALVFVAITCGGSAGGSLGELTAGAFLEYSRWTWRPSYFIAGVVCLYPLAIIAWLVPSDPPHVQNKRVDWLGSALMCTSLFLLLFSFTMSQTDAKGWKAPYIPVLIVGSALMAVAFVFRQRQLMKASGRADRPPPLIPASLLHRDCWNLLIICIASALVWAADDSFYVFVSYLWMDIIGMNKFQVGLRFSVTVLSGSTAAIVVALTINKVPPRALIAVGCLLNVVSPVLFAVRGLTWPYWAADLWALLLVHYGTDSLIAAGLTLISMTAPGQDGSVATAIFQTSGRLGYALGLAVATLIRTNVEQRALSRDVEPKMAALSGLRAGLWFCAGCLILATLVVAFGMRGWMKLNKKDKKEEEVEPVSVEPVSVEPER